MLDSLPIWVYLAAALLATRIPYIRTYLSICYTLPLEVICAVLSGGKTRRIHLIKRDPLLEPTFKHDLITYVGSTVTSLAAIGSFYLVSTHHYHFMLYLLIGLMAVSLVLWIRNFLEFLWTLSFIVLLAAPIYFNYDLVIKPVAISLAAIILVQSVLNALMLFQKSFVMRNKGRIARIPSILFGLVLLVQTLFVSYFVVGHFVLQKVLPGTTFDFVRDFSLFH